MSTQSFVCVWASEKNIYCNGGGGDECIITLSLVNCKTHSLPLRLERKFRTPLGSILINQFALFGSRNNSLSLSLSFTLSRLQIVVSVGLERASERAINSRRKSPYNFRPAIESGRKLACSAQSAPGEASTWPLMKALVLRH